jgi:hypothetical protein
LGIPILLLHSEQDEIVPPQHCEQIISRIVSKFERVPINDCTHNQARPHAAILDVFMRLERFNKQESYHHRKHNESVSRDMTISYSVDRRRGIFVYTPSKDKDPRLTLDPSFSVLRDTIEVEAVKTDNPLRSPRSRTTLLRKQPAGLKLSRRSKELPGKGDFMESESLLSNLNTIDSETTKLLNQKLSDIKEREKGVARLGRNKRFNNDKRKEIKLTHHRYLE